MRHCRRGSNRGRRQYRECPSPCHAREICWVGIPNLLLNFFNRLAESSPSVLPKYTDLCREAHRTPIYNMGCGAGVGNSGSRQGSGLSIVHRERRRRLASILQSLDIAALGTVYQGN